MKILLIKDQAHVTVPIRTLLESEFDAKVNEIDSIQMTIELLVDSRYSVDLVVCDYYGNSPILMKALLNIRPELPCIFILGDYRALNQLKSSERGLGVDPVKREYFERDLVLRIASLIKIGLGRSSEELKKTLIANRADEKEMVTRVTSALDRATQSLPSNQTLVRDEAGAALAVIQDIVSRFGFTFESQTLVGKVAALTLQLIGTKPSLKEITEHMTANEGKYITSHSIMLAELSCAIATKMGWNSAGTYFKLALAAYLHDLPLKRNAVAQCSSISEIRKLKGVDPDEVRIFSQHPMIASDYAKRMHEIPSDVDVIVAQHHELPDGTGFPRGLFARNISPLACVFIIAEDMLRFFLSRKTERSIQYFIADRGAQYKAGNFKSIIKALEGRTTVA